MDRSELLNNISTYSLCHTFATDEYDQQWVEHLTENCRAFDDWKAGRSKWYLHCSGRPRGGKTTCMAALARHLEEDRQLSRSRNCAVVTLFLDAQELEAQQLLHPSPLEVILCAILRQLKDHLYLSLDTTSRVEIEDLIHLREMVRAAVEPFEHVYALIDDVHEIPDLNEDAIFSELRSLNIRSIAFFGLPLNRMCGDHTISNFCCDKCGGKSFLWAECETCKQCYCDDCYGTDQRCCSNMIKPSMVVEVPLNLEPEAHVKLVLSDSFPDLNSQQLQDATNAILKETRDSLALAKLTLNDFTEKVGGDVLARIRGRLPRSTIRYFNLALLRVKHQRSTTDVALGLAVLAFVSLANYNGLPFNALLSILSRAQRRLGDARLFGERPDRAHISHVTKGWISIALVKDETDDPLVTLFHTQAWTYLNEEAGEFHKNALGEEGGGLALICLEALMDAKPGFDDCLSDADSVLRSTSEQALLRYALHNWGYHFRQHASQATRDAAHRFLLHYEGSRSLRNYHRRLSPSKRSVGGACMHLLADFGLHELIDHVPNHSADLMVVDRATGLTPAMVACTAGSTAFVSALLLRSTTDRTNPLSDFTLRCKMGNTALWYAIQNLHHDVVRLLLSQRGSDIINLQDAQGKTPLMLAIEHHYDIPRGVIQKQVYNTILQLLLDCKGLKLGVTDRFGKTELHIAAMRADHSAMALLLRRPAGVRIINKRESNGMQRTALMVLLSGKSHMERRLESIRLLLKSGADASLSDSRGRTVLDYAAVSDDFLVLMRELITAKGLLPTKVPLFHSALQLARAHGAEMTVELLLPLLSNSSEHMDIALSDRRDVDLASLEQSTTAGKRDMLPTQDGEVVSVAHLRNYSQFHSAVRDASLDSVQNLLASETTGALNVNDVTIDGDTALHLAIYALAEAARNDNHKQCQALERIIEALLEHVNIEAENAFNEKAIHLATRLIPDRYEALTAILEASIRSDVDVRTIRIPEAQQCLRSALTGERRCSARLVEVLLEGGASGLQPIGYGDSRLPREVAQQEELDENVVEVLLRWEESL